MNGSDEPEENQINNRDVSDSYNHRDVQLVTSILEIYKFFEQARIKKIQSIHFNCIELITKKKSRK